MAWAGRASPTCVSAGSSTSTSPPPTAATAEAEVKAMCDKLLANPVIESYRVEIAS